MTSEDEAKKDIQIKRTALEQIYHAFLERLNDINNASLDAGASKNFLEND